MEINDVIELKNLEGEEEVPMEWQHYEIKTLIVIRNEMKKRFAKLERKQSMQ